jgi:hypothetical protein
MTLREYAQQYNRPEDNNFAVHCYEHQFRQELREALARGPDETDCELWNMSHEEWQDAVQAALSTKDRRIWSDRETTPLVRDGQVLGRAVSIEDYGDVLTAWFREEQPILDDMAIIIPAEIVEQGGEIYEIPETIDLDSAIYQKYFEALVTWAAEKSCEDPEELRRRWHPDNPCPEIRWQRA